MSKRTLDEMNGTQATGFPPMTASLLETGKYSDLKITCKDRVWNVHRVVICLQSKPLAAAVDGEFAEAKTGIIELDDHDPEIVHYMLSFLYTGDYSIPQSQDAIKKSAVETEKPEAVINPLINMGTTKVAAVETDSSSDLLIHAGVYLIAEEKDIPNLKKVAKQKYEAALPNGWNSVEFCTTLRLIYEGTPDTDRLLWDVAIQFAGKKAKELLDRGEFVELWTERGEIGLEVFRAFVSALPPPPVAKSTLFLPGGTCPEEGSRHNAYVEVGRKFDWWCRLCKTGWDD